MTTTHHPLTPLSPAGHARREHILSLATQALAARRRRRTAGRIAAATLLPALALAITLAAILRGATSPSSSPSSHGVPRLVNNETIPAPAPSFHRLLVERVSTDSAALDRALVTTHAIPLSAYIDDDQLQAYLRESGRDPGIVRVGRRVVLSSELAQMFPRPKIPG